MSERQIEMYWTCSACGHRNLGRHLNCPNCGKPKDDSESYEMPHNTAGAQSVTDAGLLKIAHGGANWHCGYCGSDQRAADGFCGRCRGGRDAALDANVAFNSPSAMASSPQAARGSGFGTTTWVVLGSVLFLPPVIALIVWALAPRRPPPIHFPAQVQAKVIETSWQRTIDVERLEVHRKEGFAEQQPADAFDVAPLGKRVHHYDQVPDGFHSESYTEQESDGFTQEPYQADVPDGYRTESYTERVSCGQDCKPVPQSCSEKCTSNKNGFATCKTSCTGGGQSCTTRYCDQTRTRQIPQTKRVTQYRQVQKFKTVQKTRQIPNYRQVPSYADAFSWSVREWTPAGHFEAHGTNDQPSWPAVAVTPVDSVAVVTDGGMPEREQRAEHFTVTLSDGQRPGLSGTYNYVPHDADEFARFAPGTLHWLQVAYPSGPFEVLAAAPPSGEGLVYKEPTKH
jgi:hypothetical protein